MLDAKYSVFYSSSSDSYLVRTTSYSLPVDLHEHVAVVTPTTHFGQPFKRPNINENSFKRSNIERNPLKRSNTIGYPLKLSDQQSSGTDSADVTPSCNTTITPACLAALYNTGSYTPLASSTNKFGVTGYLDNFANYADLRLFLSKYDPTAAAEGASFEYVQVNGGGNNQSDPGDEADLDTQYAVALTDPTPVVFYSTGGEPPYIPDDETQTNTNEPYLVSHSSFVFIIPYRT